MQKQPIQQQGITLAQQVNRKEVEEAQNKIETGALKLRVLNDAVEARLVDVIDRGAKVNERMLEVRERMAEANASVADANERMLEVRERMVDANASVALANERLAHANARTVAVEVQEAKLKVYTDFVMDGLGELAGSGSDDARRAAVHRMFLKKYATVAGKILTAEARLARREG